MTTHRSLMILSALFLAACNGSDDTDTDMDTELDSDTDMGTEMAAMSITDVAASDDRFESLVAALQAAGLDDDLAAEGSFTVFAPTDDAFANAGIDISALSTAELTDILTYHVIANAEVDSGSIPARADSLAGWTLFFDTSDGVMVNNAAVVQADVMADNGVIHAIDTVLMPPTILDAAGYAGLTELAAAVGAADPAVAAMLGSEGDFTVFAPDNAAFDAAASITASLDTAGLTDVLSYHVFDGRVTSDIVPEVAESSLTNDDGLPVVALFDTSDGVMVNNALVAAADIQTTNGVVHVVDTVLVPPTVVDLAVYGGLTELVAAVGAADGELGTTLSGAGPFTVFAPTDAAFDAAASVTAGLSTAQLRDVLLFHVVGGASAVTSAELSSGEVGSLLTGQTLTVDTSGSAPTVEGATVLKADLHGTNGTVHIIDQVMVPTLAD